MRSYIEKIYFERLVIALMLTGGPERASSAIQSYSGGDGRKPQLFERDWQFRYALPQFPGYSKHVGDAVFRQHPSLDRQLLHADRGADHHQ